MMVNQSVYKLTVNQLMFLQKALLPKAVQTQNWYVELSGALKANIYGLHATMQMCLVFRNKQDVGM